MSERDVRHEAAAEERADAPSGAVEELIGHDDVERLVLLFQAADRARRYDPLDAEHLECVDVRAEIELRRKDPMADAMSRQERDALAAERADDERTGRLAKRRGNDLFLTVGQLRHLVQAAAADDPDAAGLHFFNSCARTHPRAPVAVRSIARGGRSQPQPGQTGAAMRF